MANFFEKRDPWGHGLALWVLLAAVFLAPFAFWAVRRVELHNDVENWLPADDPQSQVLSWYHGQFPVKDRVLVSWNGSTLNDPRTRLLANKLEGKKGNDGRRHKRNPYVAEVVTPHKVIRSIQSASRDAVDTSEAIRRLEGVLVGSGMMKVRLTTDGSKRIDTVKREIVERAREELGIELTVSAPQVDVPEGVKLPEIDETTSPEDVPQEFPPAPEHHLQLAWRGMKPGTPTATRLQALLKNLRGRKSELHPAGTPWVQDAFFSAGAPVAVLITLSEAGQEDTREALASVRAAAKDVGIPEDDLHLGGRSVAGSELNRQVKKAAWNRDFPLLQLHRRSPLLLSMIVGMALAFLMLRSARMATLVLLVSMYTVLLTVALVPMTHGSMNMVLVVMPTLLYVLTISASIHVANYWKHAAVRDLRTAVVGAVRMARQPCLLASGTTAIGLASLCTSPLRPVRDFGIYSAVGCLISLLVVLYLLPALLQFWPPKQPQAKDVEREGWRWLGSTVTRFRLPVTVFFLVAFGVCAYGLRWFRTETKVIRYFPDDARVVQDYHFLEDKLAGIVPIDVVVRFDRTARQKQNFLERMEVVREIEEKLRKHPEISGVIALPDFQRVHEPLAANPTTLQRMAYNKRINETERQVKEKGSQARQFLAESQRKVRLQAAADREFTVGEGDELWRITAQVAIMSDANYSDLTDELNGLVQSSLRYHAGTDHVVTGMVPVFLRTQQAVLDSLIRSFGLAFAVIAVVMMIVLRNPLAGLLAMLPNLLPVGVVFGLVSWARMPVDMGTMITASVALGIAVDGTLHLLTWFQDAIRDGRTRSEAIQRALAHCGPAMWQTSAAVSIGLLMLAPAELLLIHRFGWLMAALIAAALVADIVFLPALLAGPLGALLERTARLRSQPNEPAPPATEPVTAASPSASPEPHVLKMQSKSGKILRID
jgi:predicted RND superfamily exporter protein